MGVFLSSLALAHKWYDTGMYALVSQAALSVLSGYLELRIKFFHCIFNGKAGGVCI
jgi:hypothetical protein